MQFPEGLSIRAQLAIMAPMFVSCGIGLVGWYLGGVWFVAVFPGMALVAALWFWLQYRVRERQRAEVEAWLRSWLGAPRRSGAWEVRSCGSALDIGILSDAVVCERIACVEHVGPLGGRRVLYFGDDSDPCRTFRFGVFRRPIRGIERCVTEFYATSNSPEETPS